MTDLSLVDDDLPEDFDGEGDEGQEGNADESDGDGQGEDGEATDQADGEEDEERVAPRKQPRASDTVRESKRRAQEAETRADRLEREIAEIRATQNQQRGPSPEEIRQHQAIEAERLSMMSPEERADYRVAQVEQRLRGEMHQTRLQLAEESDRSNFRALQSSSPLARKYAADVEKVVAEQKRNGMIVNREVALKFVLGEKLFEKSSATTGKAKKDGARRIAAATGRPGRASGEASSDRAGRRGDDSIEALESRLRGVKF